MPRKKKGKRKRKRKRKTRRVTRRRRRKSEFGDVSKFVVGTGKLLVQTSAVMSIARVASNVMNP